MTQLTDDDYEIDMEVLMSTMGIDPATVGADSTKLQFISGKAVLTYTVVRAIPPRILGIAMLRSAKGVEPEPAPEAEPEPVAPTPIKKAVAKKTTTRKRTAKK